MGMGGESAGGAQEKTEVRLGGWFCVLCCSIDRWYCWSHMRPFYYCIRWMNSSRKSTTTCLHAIWKLGTGNVHKRRRKRCVDRVRHVDNLSIFFDIHRFSRKTIKTTKPYIAKPRLLLNKDTLKEPTKCLKSWRLKTHQVCSACCRDRLHHLQLLSEITLYEQELARYKAIDVQREKANNAKLKGIWGYPLFINLKYC